MASDKSAKPNSKSPLDDLPAEIVKSTAWDEETLRSIASFDEAAILVAQEHGAIQYADEVLGDGFTLLSSEQKLTLVGRPLLLMEWTFNDGDFGKFVSIRFLAQNPDKSVSKYILNDGSAGIATQLAKFTKQTGKVGGLIVKNGLRVSEYDYEDPNSGELRPAKTYYLDTSG